MKSRVRRGISTRRRLPLIVSIARLRLEAEDVLVLHVPREHLRGAFDMATGLRAQLGRRVIVLGPGMRFGLVHSREATPADLAAHAKLTTKETMP